ncbi:MAG: metalloenzyme [Stygiobacter sp.]
MKPFLMIFIDGVGIGKKDFVNNPFFKFNFKTFNEYFKEFPTIDNHFIKKNNSFIFPIDATMGIPDIPLSGTGQTSIFCGVNASKIIGKHFGPFPYSTLIPIIKEKNIFYELKKKKRKVEFVNAYPKIFFDYVNSGKKRLSVTTLSCLLSDVPLHKISDLHKGKALSAEIDNERLKTKLGYKLKILKPATAANRLIKIASKNNFTLFEIFHTDHLGHGRYIDKLEYFSKVLDEFLFKILTKLPKNMNLLICSDHGNYEDLSIKMHTLNPALGIASGPDAKILSSRIKALYDIKSVIMGLID